MGWVRAMGGTVCVSDHSNIQLGPPPLIPEPLPSKVIIIIIIVVITITLFMVITVVCAMEEHKGVGQTPHMLSSKN